MTVFWVIPKDNNLLYVYTEVMTGECSVSPSKSYTAVTTVNFHYHCSVVNSNVRSNYFIFNVLKSIKIYMFLHFDLYMEICNTYFVHRMDS